ncbi:MAG TPA: L-histidine N(alpha)-methyltransferase [Polyangia bacterium]|nr:L-histidine N(alpha)-methyltransferase [Polyangia bacterium]
MAPPLSGSVGSLAAKPRRRSSVDVFLDEEERIAMLRAEARRGLTSLPKQLPPKWFYDQRGSELFEEITRLPEYYLTRSEREILLRRADEIASLTNSESLVELGSGSSEKTTILLDALVRRGSLTTFVPFDVCLPALQQASAALAREYPDLAVHAIVGDFDHHLPLLPRQGRRLVAFLGSTIGNFDVDHRASFFAQLGSALAPGDFLLLGTDLVKDPARLEAAYNDSAGVTAAFNRNVLRVLNRDLGADFVEDQFQHVATYDGDRDLIDIRLRSLQAQRVNVGALKLVVPFAAGEEMRTEISAKFTRAGLQDELGTAGYFLVRWWTDRAGDFALSLWGV